MSFKFKGNNIIILFQLYEIESLQLVLKPYFSHGLWVEETPTLRD